MVAVGPELFRPDCAICHSSTQKERCIFDIDEKDRVLLRALKRNARARLVALAREVGLSRSATHDRITKLEELGVIQGYTIKIASEALPEVKAFLTVTYKVGESQTAVIDEIMKLPGVEANYCISGDIDSLIYCECESMRELADLRDEIAGWSSVTHIATRQILASSKD